MNSETTKIDPRAFYKDPYDGLILSELACEPGPKDHWRPILQKDAELTRHYVDLGLITYEGGKHQITANGKMYLRSWLTPPEIRSANQR